MSRLAAITLITTIGTFDVLDEKCVLPFAVRDRCEFNNWGVAFFRSEKVALAYAEWAHKFKLGRTYAEFYHPDLDEVVN